MMVSMWAFLAWMFFTLVLAWRVWRLEDRVGRVQRSDDRNYDILATRIRNLDTMAVNRIRCAEDRANNGLSRERLSREVVDRRIISLARALGYEWKRTEAKEGWERKSPFGFGEMAAYERALHNSVCPQVFSAPPPKSPTKRSTKKAKRATH